MSDAPESDERTFEQLLDELEAMTRRMAAGDIGIEAAAALYERAGELHALATERLARVQERIERLAADAGDAGGQSSEPGGSGGSGTAGDRSSGG